MTMPSTEDILRQCCTVSEVPRKLDRSAVTSLISKKYSATIERIEIVEGGEADEELQRWIVCFKSADDAEYLYRNIQHQEIELEVDKWCTVKYLETTACEVPSSWISMDDDDLESDGDPEQPPKPPEKPKKPADFAPQYPSLSEAQPFSVSGFYHNIPTSGPGQSNQGPGQGPLPFGPGQPAQNPGQGQGPPPIGFPQPPYFFPPMGQPAGGYSPSMPQDPPGAQGPQQGPGQPGFGHFPAMPMWFQDEATGQWFPVFQPPMGPGGPNVPAQRPGMVTARSDSPRGQGRGSPPPYSSAEVASDNYTSRTNVKERHAGDSGQAVQDQVDYMEKLQHKIDQDNLQQEEEGEPEEEAPRTKIIVTNLPSSLDEEYLEMLFENKKKQGGGQVASVELDRDQAQAIIEFEEPEAVSIVLGKLPIKVKGHDLQIEVYVPEEGDMDTAQAKDKIGHNEPEEKPTKILVSDIPPQVDEDFLSLYFENTKKSGGGAVANVELNEEDGVAIIEFQNPQAVQIVLDKQRKQSLTMYGAQVSVEVHIPEVEKDDAEDLVGGEDDPVKILITNIPEKAQEEEYLTMFFEKHGGDIVNVELLEEFAASVIEFEDSSAVEKVLNKQPLHMYRAEVEIRAYNPRYIPRDTVEVRGQGLEKDLLEMYFESKKRSGGGPTENIELVEEEEVAYIKFETEEIARRVVDKGNHAVGRLQMSVELYEPPDPLFVFLKRKTGIPVVAGDTSKSCDKMAKSRAKEVMAEPASRTSQIVKVRGMKKVKSSETVQYYFENSRRSGGGEITEMKTDKEDDNVMFIHFKSEKVAKAVSDRASHVVDNSELSVSLYIPPPPRPIYENKLLIKGVLPSTTKDCLFNFLEAKSGGIIPEDQQQGEKDTIRLVSFQTAIDFERLQKNAVKLEGATLELEQVTVSNCIYVANYDETMGKDTIELYFENSARSGGGQVEKVVFNEEEGYWLVYFADYQVIENVLEREHKLGQNKLIVKLFVECLGRPQGGDGEIRFKVPDPVLVSDASSQKVRFILSSNVSRRAMDHQMDSCYTRIPWPPKDAKPPFQLKLECTLTQKTKNCYKLARDWKQNAIANFQDYLKTIAVLQTSVRTELWPETVKTLQEITIDNPESIAVFVEKEQGNVTVVGVKKPAEHLSSEIKQKIKKIEEAADLAKQRVKETVTSLKLIETKMLLAIKYPTKMEEKYKDLKVKINQNKNELTFDGLGKDIQSAKLEMYEIKNHFDVRVCKDVSLQALGMYQLKQVKEHIVKTLKQRNVSAVWDVDNNELVICSPSMQTLSLCVEIVRDAVKENVIPLSKASRSIVNSDEWDHMVQDTQVRYPGKAMITVPDMSNIVVTTTDDVEQDVVSIVKRFLSANSILDEKVKLSSSVSKLLSQHHRAEVNEIAKSLVADHVQIIWNKCGFDIRGNEKGVAAAQAQLQQLASQVKSKDHTITKPGLGAYLSQHSGRENISAVESQLPCVIGIKGEEEEEGQYETVWDDAGYSAGRIAQQGGPALPQGMRLHASCVTPDDRKIFTVEGDMTEMTVDVLVNTVDKKLSLAGGLGKVILNKGGKKVKDACAEYISSYSTLEEGDVFLSPGGNLKAGSVIHVVGPAWQSGQTKERERLKEAVSKVMKQAALKNVCSIAFPAISCGTFGFPSKVATSVIVQAIQNFFREEQDCSVNMVYLCDVKQETILNFTEALKSCFGRVTISPVKAKSGPGPGQAAERSAPRPKPRIGVPVLPTGQPPSKIPGTKTVIGNINVTIVKGELAKEKVNAIVNTTADNLDLNNGAVSKSLLNAAGKELQDEVTANHPGKLKFGEIVKTKGYNLNCDLVMHTALPNYDGAPAVQILKNVMDKCLTEASQQSFTKVAFPAIGTGNLRFPKDVVAKEMFNAIEAFTKKCPQSSISEVKFVVYHKDNATVKAFEMEETKWLSGTRVVAQRQTRAFGPVYQHLPKTRKATNSSGSGSDSGTDYEEVDDDESDYAMIPDIGDSQDSPFGDINVIVKSGDITREACDCIVNSSNEDLDLSRGAVSQALLRKGGKKLERELDRERSTMKQDHIAMTSAHGLQCSNIIHIVAQDTTSGWKKMTDKCLQYAETNRMRCIAFPALGTGISMKAADIAEVMVTSVMEFQATGPQFLREVRFVIFQKGMEQDFHDAVRDAKSKRPGLLSKAWQGMKAMAGFGKKDKGMKGRKPAGRPMTDSNTVTFTIYAKSDEVISKAIQKLENIVDKAVFKKEFTDSTIKKLDGNQIMEVKGIAKQHCVDIKLDDRKGFIEISGIHTNVMDVTDKIYGILRAADDLEHQKNEASLIANITQWYFIEVTDVDTRLTKYDPESNRKIEKAFKKQEPTVDLVDNTGKVYIVDFAKMEEYPRDNLADTVKVIRRDLIKEGSFEPPATWSKMGDTENLKVVTLQATDNEYKDMAQKFAASAGGAYTITKIERVQNKTLWQQYQAKKKQLEQQNPANTKNERLLWHGFAVDAMDSINAHGFNRSYCGKNATMYGDGVYFAVNSNYSCRDTYSVPDPSSTKHVYYCHVLTGEYAHGARGMRVPPSKPGSSATALYDSVVDNVLAPNMFIVFNDTQAYPEYIIHFKR